MPETALNRRGRENWNPKPSKDCSDFRCAFIAQFLCLKSPFQNGCPGRAGRPAQIPRIQTKIFCRIFVPRILHRFFTRAGPPSQAGPETSLKRIEEFRCLKSCSHFAPAKTALATARSQGCLSGPSRVRLRLQHLFALYVAVILMPQVGPGQRVGEATSLPCVISPPQKLHTFAARSRSGSQTITEPVQVY
jgi:hypothetical protein